MYYISLIYNISTKISLSRSKEKMRTFNHLMHLNRNEKVPVVFKSFKEGEVHSVIKFLDYQETWNLNTTNFEWRHIDTLDVWGMVQKITTIGMDVTYFDGKALKREKKAEQEKPAVALIVSEGMLEKVNKILNKKEEPN